MRKPYWVIQNGKADVNPFTSEFFELRTTNQVVSGDSPLLEMGAHYLKNPALISHLSNRLWLFPNEYIQSAKQASMYGMVFRFTYGAAAGLRLSHPGVIIPLGKELMRQPPNPINVEVMRTMPVVAEIADLCHTLAMRAIGLDGEKPAYWFRLLEELYEMSSSSYFIGQLSLWAYIEHEWAPDKLKTNLHQSLSNLLHEAFGDQVQKRRAVKQTLIAAGKQLGQPYDESMLRNILAHGKHYAPDGGWSDNDWALFSEVHDLLFELVIRGLEKRLQQQQEIIQG